MRTTSDSVVPHFSPVQFHGTSSETGDVAEVKVLEMQSEVCSVFTSDLEPRSGFLRSPNLLKPTHPYTISNFAGRVALNDFQDTNSFLEILKPDRDTCSAKQVILIRDHRYRAWHKYPHPILSLVSLASRRSPKSNVALDCSAFTETSVWIRVSHNLISDAHFAGGDRDLSCIYVRVPSAISILHECRLAYPFGILGGIYGNGIYSVSNPVLIDR